MKDILRVIAANVGLAGMWAAAIMISWKVLDRPGVWPTIAVIIIFLFASFSVYNATDQSPKKPAKKKPVKK